MRNVVVGLLIVFSFPIFSYADDPVPLEVWTAVKSYGFDLIENPIGVGDRFTYVPNFKKGEVPHAFVISYREPNTDIQAKNKTYTWGFSRPDDTVNLFRWPNNFFPYATPDMNGDGRRDFMNGTGVFYLGTEKDEPDTNKPYQIDGNGVGYNKLNNDNCDDVYYYGNIDVSEKSIAHFVFGNPTLKRFQTYTVISTHATADTQSYEQTRAIYKNKQGQWRLLTHCMGWVRGTYTSIWKTQKAAMRLYSLEFVKVHEDSTTVIATQIDEYRDPKWLEFQEDNGIKDPLNWRPFNPAGLVYNSEHYPRILYYASFNTLPDKVTKKYDSYATIIDLTDDKIKPTNNNVTQTATGCTVLRHSIDSDNIPDLAAQLGDWNIHFFRVLSDGQIKEISVLKTTDIIKDGLLSKVQSIDDINGDNISDISCLLINNSIGNAFIVAKGADIGSAVNENEPADFFIGSPHPVPNIAQLIIPLHCKRTGLYSLTLHNIQGNSYTLFSHQLLSIGETQHILSSTEFPSGAYILRLTNDKTTVEKSILIQH